MEDTRQKILNTAGQQFADKGYKGTTIRDICRKAGVNVAAVNYHFGGKETLYKEVVASSHPADVRDKTEFPPDMPARDKLHAFILGFLTHIRSLPRDSWHLRLMMRELNNPTPCCRDAICRIFQDRLDELMAIFEELVPGAPEYFLKRLAFGIFGQCIVYRSDGVPQLLLGQTEVDRHFQSAQLAAHILTATLASLGLAEPLVSVPAGLGIEEGVGVEEDISHANGVYKGEPAR